MTGNEMLKEVRQQRVPDLHFIKWWRPENDFVDYELIDDFLAHLEPDQQFGGFELLTDAQMWARLFEECRERVRKVHRISGDYIIWRHEGQGGIQVEEDRPFTPQNLIRIFDTETRGNTLC